MRASFCAFVLLLGAGGDDCHFRASLVGAIPFWLGLPETVYKPKGISPDVVPQKSELLLTLSVRRQLKWSTTPL